MHNFKKCIVLEQKLMMLNSTRMKVKFELSWFNWIPSLSFYVMMQTSKKLHALKRKNEFPTKLSILFFV